MTATETTKPAPTESRTKIIFDLADELTQREIDMFQQAADAAGASSLTEHFLNTTIRPFTTPFNRHS